MSRRRVLAQARFELRLLARNGENLLVTLVIPLAVLVFFTVVPVLPTGHRSPVDVLTPGAVTIAVMGSAMVSLGISTAFERDQQVIKRLGATPLRRRELVAAKSLAVLAIVVVQVLLLAVTAAALGWRPHVSPLRLTAAAATVLLAAAAFAGIGLSIAGWLPSLRALAVINGTFLLFLLLAGVIVPLHLLPTPLSVLALGLPPLWTTALLSAASGASDLASAAPGWAVLTVWAAGASATAARAFRWE